MSEEKKVPDLPPRRERRRMWSNMARRSPAYWHWSLNGDSFEGWSAYPASEEFDEFS